MEANPVAGAATRELLAGARTAGAVACPFAAAGLSLEIIKAAFAAERGLGGVGTGVGWSARRIGPSRFRPPPTSGSRQGSAADVGARTGRASAARSLAYHYPVPPF